MADASPAISPFLGGDPVCLGPEIASPGDVLSRLGLPPVEAEGCLPIAPGVALIHSLTGDAVSMMLRWVNLPHRPRFTADLPRVETAVVLIAPLGDSARALRLVGRLMACLAEPGIADRLRAATTREALVEALAPAPARLRLPRHRRGSAVALRILLDVLAGGLATWPAHGRHGAALPPRHHDDPGGHRCRPGGEYLRLPHRPRVRLPRWPVQQSACLARNRGRAGPPARPGARSSASGHLRSGAARVRRVVRLAGRPAGHARPRGGTKVAGAKEAPRSGS